MSLREDLRLAAITGTALTIDGHAAADLCALIEWAAEYGRARDYPALSEEPPHRSRIRAIVERITGARR